MSTNDLYNEKIVAAIESKFGPYKRAPKLQATKDLYNRYGAWGQTTYVRESRLPILIEVDKALMEDNPREGTATVCHEMLEWKAIEEGEDFPHRFAMTHQDKIISQSNLTPIDMFLQHRPILRMFVLGY